MDSPIIPPKKHSFAAPVPKASTPAVTPKTTSTTSSSTARRSVTPQRKTRLMTLTNETLTRSKSKKLLEKGKELKEPFFFSPKLKDVPTGVRTPTRRPREMIPFKLDDSVADRAGVSEPSQDVQKFEISYESGLIPSPAAASEKAEFTAPSVLLDVKPEYVNLVSDRQLASADSLSPPSQATQLREESWVEERKVLQEKIAILEKEKLDFQKRELNYLDKIKRLENDPMSQPNQAIQMAENWKHERSTLEGKLETSKKEKLDLQRKGLDYLDKIKRLESELLESKSKDEERSNENEIIRRLETAILRLKREQRQLKTDISSNLSQMGSSMEGFSLKLVKSHEALISEKDRISSQNDKLLTEKSILIKENNDMNDLLHKLHSERKKILEENIGLKGNIRVFTRVRPVLGGKQREEEFKVIDSEQILLRGKSYTYDKVFDEDATQADVFKDIRPLVHSCANGYNICIFAYGQTGSGKTHTMEGTTADPGVNYLAIQELFRLTDERSFSYAYTIELSVVEIYNEQLFDLLKEKSEKLAIRENRNGNSHIPGLTSKPVKTLEDVRSAMERALQNRSTSSTNLNERSSRSHCLSFVNVTGVNLETGVKNMGSLVLIDLAGSERVDRSGAQGSVLTEAKYINKSLSALGNVIEKLQKKAPHIPYRDSKLTLLLRNHFRGQSKVLMCCQISPERVDMTESTSSLTFAERARKIVLGKAKKQTESTELGRLKKEIEQLQQQKSCLENRIRIIEKRELEARQKQQESNSAASSSRRFAHPSLSEDSRPKRKFDMLSPIAEQKESSSSSSSSSSSRPTSTSTATTASSNRMRSRYSSNRLPSSASLFLPRSSNASFSTSRSSFSSSFSRRSASLGRSTTPLPRRVSVPRSRSLNGRRSMTPRGSGRSRSLGGSRSRSRGASPSPAVAAGGGGGLNRSTVSSSSSFKRLPVRSSRSNSNSFPFGRLPSGTPQQKLQRRQQQQQQSGATQRYATPSGRSRMMGGGGGGSRSVRTVSRTVSSTAGKSARKHHNKQPSTSSSATPMPSMRRYVGGTELRTGSVADRRKRFLSLPTIPHSRGPRKRKNNENRNSMNDERKTLDFQPNKRTKYGGGRPPLAPFRNVARNNSRRKPFR